MKKLIKLSLFLGVLYAVARFCNNETDGFTIADISSDYPFHPEWATLSPNTSEKEELRKIFQQPFSYLAKGGQCYAFISEDEKYVLKFFKQNQHARLPFLVDIIPLPKSWEEFREGKREVRRKRIREEFASYMIAYRDLKKETALELLHLNKTDDLQMKAKIVDKLHIEHEIDLDKFAFILQKRAEPVLPYLQGLIQKNEIDGAKEALHKLFQTLATIKEKGIVNLDPNLQKNFGFIEKEAVQIDLGKFSKREISQKELFGKKTRNAKFQKWLETQDNELGLFFQQESEKL